MVTNFRYRTALRLGRIGNFVKAHSNPIIRWGLAGTSLLLFVYFLLFIVSAEVTFSVNAEVQYVEGALSSKESRQPLYWHFRDVSLCDATLTKKEASCKRFSGVVSFGAGTRFRIWRPGSGPLSIVFQGENNSIKVDDDAWPDASPLMIKADNPGVQAQNGHALVLPFLLTDFKLGALPRVGGGGQPRTLRSGVIRMYKRTLWGDQPFEVGEKKLEHGDVFVVNEPLSDYAGFIDVDELPGMRVVVRVVGEEAALHRFFMDDTPIRAVWFERLSHDPVIAATVGLLTFVLIILSTIIAGRCGQTQK